MDAIGIFGDRLDEGLEIFDSDDDGELTCKDPLFKLIDGDVVLFCAVFGSDGMVGLICVICVGTEVIGCCCWG